MSLLQLLCLLLICVFAQGFFSMFEMAAVSFNKIRLEYYVGQKKRRAIWLSYLLKNPSRLFGTTLIMVNTLLQCGSEISRLFYASIGMSPDFAPITQIFIVLIFGELAPMFAARRHPEHVAFLYIPVVIFFSRLLIPIIWVIDKLNRFLHRVFGKSKDLSLFLSREELQRAFEEGHQDSFDQIMGRFFTMKNLRAKALMEPFNTAIQVSSKDTIKTMRSLLQKQYSPFVMVYHQKKENIVAIGYIRDMLLAKDHEKVIDYTKSPWFIIESALVLEILSQFRRNNQSVAVVLGASGKATGLITLNALTDEIFGRSTTIFHESLASHSAVHFEKTVSGEMKLKTFNQMFFTELLGHKEKTLSDYLIKQFGHHPVKGEILLINNLEIQVLETSMFSIKLVSVKSL